MATSNLYPIFASGLGVGLSNIGTNVFQVQLNGSSNALTVASNALVGIGKSNPVYPLDVSGSINFTGSLLQNGAPMVSGQFTTVSSSNVYLPSGSNLGVGKSAPAYALDVSGSANVNGGLYMNGIKTLGSSNLMVYLGSSGSTSASSNLSIGGNLDTVTLSGQTVNVITTNTAGGTYAGMTLKNGATAWATYSDARLKNNVTPMSNCLDLIDGVNPVKYQLDGLPDTRVGVIAQDVAAVLPEVVEMPEDPTDFMKVRYAEILPLLFGAIKELKAEVEQLEANQQR